MKFVQEKSYVFKVYRALCLQLQWEQDKGIVCICSDHSRKFENHAFNEFYESKGNEFSAPFSPQQNGVVERKNQSLQEMAWVMLHPSLYF